MATTSDKLYQFLKANTDGIPDRALFDQAMQDKGKRESLHKFMQSNFDGVPDFETFDRQLGARNRTFFEKVGDTTKRVTDFLDTIVDPEKIQTTDPKQDLQAVGKWAQGVGQGAVESVTSLPGSLRKGYQQGLVAQEINRKTPDPKRMASLISEQQRLESTLPKTQTDRALQGGASSWEAFAANPVGFIVNIGAESLAGMVPRAMEAAPGIIAGSMATGAAAGVAGVGAPTGGLGAAPGAAAGATVGAAAAVPLTVYDASAVQKQAEIVVQELQAHGVDMGNPEAIREAFANKPMIDEIKAKAQLPASITGFFDGLSAMAGGTISETVAAGTAKRGMSKAASKIAGEVAEYGAEAGMGMAGEGGAQVAYSGKITSPDDVVAEGLAETPVMGMASRVAKYTAAKTVQGGFSMADRVRQKVADRRAAKGRVQGNLGQAIVQQESSGRADVVNRKSGATGLWQITSSFLADGNRFLGTSYTMEDMKDPAKATAITNAWHEHYARQFFKDNGRWPTPREVAMMHHGGPKGYRNPNAVDAEGISNATYADQVTERLGQTGGDELSLPEAPAPIDTTPAENPLNPESENPLIPKPDQEKAPEPARPEPKMPTAMDQLETEWQDVEHMPSSQPKGQTEPEQGQGFRSGSKTPIIAGGKSFGEVEYRLIERNDLVSSHHPMNFTENPAYPQERQNRDYSNLEVRGKAEDAIKGIRDNGFITLLQPVYESDTGMPTVNEDGVVLSGNNRSFAIYRHYGDYRKALNATNLNQFGLTPADIGAMKEPVLVRVMADKGKEADFVIQSNVQKIKTLTPDEIRKHFKALPDDRKEQARHAIGGIYQEFNKGAIEKIDTFLTNLALSELPMVTRKHLLDSHALSDADMQGNALTSTGIEKVKMLALTLLNEEMKVPDKALDYLSGSIEKNGNLDRKFDAAIGDIFLMRGELQNEFSSEMGDIGKALVRRISVLINPEPYRAQSKELSMQKAIRGISASEEPLSDNAGLYYRAMASDTISSLRKVVSEKVSRQDDMFAPKTPEPAVPAVQDGNESGKGKEVSLQGKPEPKNENEHVDNERLGKSGDGALEGVSAKPVQGPEGSGNATAGSRKSGRTDGPGNGSADSGRVSGARGLGDGQRAVPVSTGGGSTEAEVGSGAVRERPAETSRGDDQGNEQGQPGRGVRGRVTAQDQPSRMFTITEDVALGEGGQKTKFKNNVAAIKLLKQLEAENRMATHDEQKVLALYVGWGGIPQAFVKSNGMAAKGWESEAEALRSLLSKDEYEAARRSTQDAHYTSREVVNAIWTAVKEMGFSGGRVLEPSVGTGNFIGLMPQDIRSGSQITAVELDNITGSIAKHLYPGANIKAPVGFQDVSMADGFFNLAIGNPPFGNQKLYDASKEGKELNGFSIHNYFFAKSINKLQDNGILAMVVSNRFLDAFKDKARQYIADRAEFLGAIRLPNNAFLKNAGTEVTTDIIFMRKLPEEERGSRKVAKWLDVEMVKDKSGVEIPLNGYFVEHPEMMLGEWGAHGSMYGPNEPALVAKEGQDTQALLKDAIARLPKHITTGVQEQTTAMVKSAVEAEDAIKIGSMFVKDGALFRKEIVVDEFGVHSAVGTPITFKTSKDAARVKGMIGIRDAFTELRIAQIDERTTDKQVEFLRKKLNTLYDRFIKEFGYINGQTNKRLFREDPTWPQISALEEGYDKGISSAVAKSTGEKPKPASARKAAIFTKRTQAPYRPVTSVASAKDALSASLSEFGRIDMEHMSKLYGKSKDEIIEELGVLVFEDPERGIVTRDEYLSGNVKQKLARAKEAATNDDRFKRNVEELLAVIPADIEAVDISVKPGAPWIPASDVQDFMTLTTGDPNAKAFYTSLTAKWTGTARASDAMQAKYGTDRVRAVDVVFAALNGKQITVNDKLEDGRLIVNRAATAAANDKVEAVKESWASWIWQDDERRGRLSRLYNDTFNTDRIRNYDGSHLTFPGKVSDDTLRLRPHQANAVWRILQRGTTLLDHVVGAGKTFTMIAAAMEMRRMGLAKKPVFVVPNHLVGQWAADFVRLYPGANVLAPSKNDFESTNRKRLFSRIATGDWDAVIVAHSSYKLLQNDPQFECEFLRMQIDEATEAIENARAEQGKDARSVKDMEKMRERLQARLMRLLDAGNKDDNLTIAELGVDALFVDEAHEFKNLSFHTSMTRVGGLNPAGSQRASDMFTKVLYVLQRTGGRNIIFATGTPISNTMAEMFTMQRYLQYRAMQGLGVSHFDSWAKMYGDVVTDWELSPAGKYVMRSRFSRFVNIPELMQQYLTFADVITRDDIKRQLAEIGQTLPIPKMISGKPVNVVVERSNDQANYIGVPKVDEKGNEVYPEGCLVWRSENLPKGKPKKGDDNMLVIMGLARKAALDMRLIDPLYPDYAGSKVNVAAKSVVEQYRKWDKVKGTQLVFCDLSIPANAKQKEAARITELIRRADEGDDAAEEELGKLSPDDIDALQAKFSVYDDLKEKLVHAGIPEHEIAFIHDATTELKKEELFGKVRSGRVRVLMGSTAKMGAGMNVQERLVALHHLDAPWRPSDLEQREGRIIRQGNILYDADPQGFEVLVARYATKNTLDSRMWQTLETKARFIEQIRSGSIGDRVIDDVEGEAANAAEMKAASSGNPLILEEMTLRQKIQKLNQQKSNYDREQFSLRDKIKTKERALEVTQKRLTEAKADLETSQTIGDFTMTVGGRTFDKRLDAGRAFIDALIAHEQKDAAGSSKTLGKIGGFAIGYQTSMMTGQPVLYVYGDDDYPAGDVKIDPNGLMVLTDGELAGIATRLFNAAKNGPKMSVDGMLKDIAGYKSDIPKLKEQLKPWGKEDELASAKKRQRDVIEELKPKRSESEGGDGSVSAMAAPVTPMPGYQPPYSKIGMPLRPASGAIVVAGQPIKLNPEDNPTRIEQIRKMVTDLIGSRLYFGKIKSRPTVQGFYREQNGELRMRNYSDVEAMAHEVAHWLESYYDAIDFNGIAAMFANEIEQLSYTDNPRLVRSEGFAEYFRLWFTQYDEAASRAPGFTAALAKVLSKSKRLGPQLYALRAEMHKWYFQGDMARLNAVTSGNRFTAKERLTAWIAQRPLSLLRQQFVDGLHAAKLMASEAGNGIRTAAIDPYKQLQLLNGVEGIVQESFLHGAPEIDKQGTIKFTGPSLESIWKESLDKGMKVVRAQELYFIARRARELKAQGRENLINVGMIRAGLQLEQTYPWFRDAFENYQKFNKNMVLFMVDCGYIEPGIAKQWMEVNKNYVPFNREAEGIASSFAGSGNLKRLKGGTQNLKHVYDNILLSNAQHIKGALRARAMRQLYSEALNDPDGGKWIAPIGKDSQLVKSTIEQQAQAIAEAMAQLGLTMSSNGMIISGNPQAQQITDVSDIMQILVNNPEMLQFWTFGHKPRTAETGVDSFIDRRTGKRRWVEIQRDNQLLLDMVNNMAGHVLPDGIGGMLMKTAILVKQVQTMTVTAAWQFAGPNIIRDMQQAAVLSGGKFRPIIDNVFGLASMLHDLLKREGWYHEMKSQGGGWSTRVRSIMTDTWQMQQGSMVPKTRSWYNPIRMSQAVLDAAMSVADAAEMSTRVGFYIRQRKSGMPAREAAWQSREISTDFRKHGSYALWWNIQRTVPFLGAFIQGIDRDLRAIAEEGGRLSPANILKLNKLKARIYAAGGLMISLGIALALANEDDDRYKDLTPDQKTRFFHFFIGDKHLTLPKAHGFFTLMMNAGEALVDYLKGQGAEDSWKYLAFSIQYQLGADIMPGVANPLYELATNRSFTGAPIIAERLQGLPPEYQFTDRTPAMYVNIGQALKISPDAVQYLVRGYTGYVSDFINEASESALWNRQVWGERPFAKDAAGFIGKQFVQSPVPYRTKWTEKYYDLRRHASEKAAALSYLQKAPAIKDNAMIKRFAEDREALKLAAANQAFREIDQAFKDQEMKVASIKYNQHLTAHEKEAKIEEYYRQKNELLKSAYQEIEKALQ